MPSRMFNDDETVIEQHIGARIRDARQELGWSQEKLADMVGVDRAMLARYERAQAHLFMVRLLSIAVCLGKPLSYFVCDLPNPRFRPKDCVED